MRLPILLLVGLLTTGCSKEQSVPEKPASVKPVAQAPIQITEPIPSAYVEPVVGGAVMSAGKDLMSNLSASKDHTKFVAAIKAAGMFETLQGAGPFTVFAPTNAAFAALPNGRLEALMKPGSRDELTTLLAYHIVLGKLDGPALQKLILAGDGSTKLKTVEGSMVTATVGNGEATLIDVHNNSARVTVASVVHVNGVMHVINRVLEP